MSAPPQGKWLVLMDEDGFGRENSGKNKGFDKTLIKNRRDI